MDSSLRSEGYILDITYRIGDTIYVGSTRMIYDGGTFTSEDSNADMWITSTMPPLFSENKFC
jgi:hypothetical protein